MKIWRNILAAAIALPLAAAVLPMAHVPAHAESQGIVAVVNDQPITERDLTQRITLLKLLDDLPQGGMSRKQALQSLIDDQVKMFEATRLMLVPNDGDVSDRIEKIAKGMKLSEAELLSKLKREGISEKSFRSYVQASLAFSRLIAAKYREDVKASPGEVDAKMREIKTTVDGQMAKIMNDPRMKPITVYSLMEISLPLDSEDPMMLQSRAIEAQQVLRQFKGCGNTKAAAQGVFNVKFGKKFEADAAKLPKPMKAALDKAGEGRAVGPMRNKSGIQLIAFCGVRRITPPKPDFTMPSREQIERMVINDKYDKIEENYLNTVREKIYVEYRDPTYAQQ